MEKQNQGILEGLKSKVGLKGSKESEEKRPVKWIKEAENVWRIVYAD